MNKKQTKFLSNIKLETEQWMMQLMPICLTAVDSPLEQLKQILAINEILVHLLNIQKNYGFISKPKNRYAQKDVFCKWLSSHNIKLLNKMNLVESKLHGFGVYSLEPIKKEEPIVFIPRTSILLYSDLYKIIQKSSIYEDPLLSKMPNISLALYLLDQAYDDKSQWQPYIGFLPATFSTPLYYTKEELLASRDLLAFPDICNHLKSIARQYVYIYRLLQNLSINKDSAKFMFAYSFTYADYRWAVSCVTTRQNKIPSGLLEVGQNANVEGESEELALIPFLDMFNHCATLPLTTDYDGAKQGSVVYAAKDYEKGEEILINYGRRTSSEFLIHNGFVPKEYNPHDAIKLKFGLVLISDSDSISWAKLDSYINFFDNEKGLNLSEQLNRDKRSILQNLCTNVSKDQRLHASLSLNETSFIVSMAFTLEKVPVEGSQLAILRIICASLEEVDAVNKSIANDCDATRDLKLLDNPITLVNERKTWKFLQTRCQLYHDKHNHHLNSYHIDQEAKNINDENVRNLMKKETEVLLHLLDFCTKMLRSLDDKMNGH